MTPVRRWFLQVARAEGSSLLVLLLGAMPAKYVLGIPDATAWVGWLHGTLVFVYLVALGSVSRVEAWTWGRTGAAFVASVIPGGTFLFEARLSRTTPEAAGAVDPLPDRR
ncbi:MAG: DUF3817 domain-containing protein [Alphaproteobacteria bacterium]|nr:DUF3817 domain-containing protein [Alphaproteobacteria bacterium]